MDIEGKLGELNKRKTELEGMFQEYNESIIELQKKIGLLNNEYLINKGQIEAYNEMRGNKNE